MNSHRSRPRNADQPPVAERLPKESTIRGPILCIAIRLTRIGRSTRNTPFNWKRGSRSTNLQESVALDEPAAFELSGPVARQAIIPKGMEAGRHLTHPRPEKSSSAHMRRVSSTSIARSPSAVADRRLIATLDDPLLRE